jgi:hypothetical protein
LVRELAQRCFELLGGRRPETTGNGWGELAHVEEKVSVAAARTIVQKLPPADRDLVAALPPGL